MSERSAGAIGVNTDECPDCGGVGIYLGSMPIGRAGPPYTEVYRCITENCEREEFGS